MRTQQQDAPGRPLSLSVSVSAAGAVVGGVGVAVTKTGTGAYTLRVAGFRAITTLTPAAGSASFLAAFAPTPDTVSVAVYTSAAAPVDLAFMLAIVGIAK